MGLHIYKNRKGEIIPSVTEIIYSTRPQSETIKWAKINEKKRKETEARGEVWIDSKKEEARDRGTRVHGLVEEALIDIWEGKEIEVKPEDVAEFDIKSYYQSFLLYLEKLGKEGEGEGWEILKLESSVVSEHYQYGGKLDMLLRIGDKNRLIDIKTFGGYYHQGRQQECHLWNFWRSPKTYTRTVTNALGKKEKRQEKEMMPEQPGWGWVNDSFGCKNAVRQLMMYYLAATEMGIHIDQLQVLVLSQQGYQEIRLPMSWFWSDVVADIEGRIKLFYETKYNEWKEKALKQIQEEEKKEKKERDRLVTV